MIATTNVPNILWLGNRACDDPAEVGGKAAHLSWIIACAIAEPKDVGYIRRGYHNVAPCAAAYGTI